MTIEQSAIRWNEAIERVQHAIRGGELDNSPRYLCTQSMLDAAEEMISAGRDLIGLRGRADEPENMYLVICGNCTTEFWQAAPLPQVSTCSVDCQTDYDRRVRAQDRIPEVGMPCTMSLLGDSYPAEITWVSPSKHQFRFCRVEHAAHGIGCPDDLATRRPDGKYRPAGGKYGFLHVGEAFYRRDPHV